MVRKLFKHEFAALGRLVLPVICAILGTGILTRFVYLFENDSVYFGIVGGSSIMMMAIAIWVGVVLTGIFAIVRFYKNLFSCEGYLSFTLPVTPTQHLLVKSVTAVVFEIITILASVLSVAIALLGEPLIEVIKAGFYLWGKLMEEVNGFHFCTFLVEYGITLLIGLFVTLFLYYTCICLGQLAKKNRIIWSVGAFFAYYFGTQVLSTVLFVVGTALSMVLPMEQIMEFISEHPYLTMHTFGIGGIVVSLVVLTVYFVVCNFIMSKKLNLE